MDLNQTYDASFSPSAEIGRRAGLEWGARIISIMGAPPMVTVLSLALVVTITRDPILATWALVFVLCTLPAPLGYVVWKVRTGEISDLDMSRREERIKPYIVITLATTLGALMVYLAQPPRLLLIVVCAALIETILLFVTTFWWKISAHSAATAALAVLAAGLAGPQTIWVLLSIPLVIWSRLYLKRHTFMETMAGTALGVIVAVITLAVYQG